MAGLDPAIHDFKGRLKGRPFLLVSIHQIRKYYVFPKQMSKADDTSFLNASFIELSSDVIAHLCIPSFYVR